MLALRLAQSELDRLKLLANILAGSQLICWIRHCTGHAKPVFQAPPIKMSGDWSSHSICNVMKALQACCVNTWHRRCRSP